MKRLLGAFIILVLLFSLCACDDSPKETQLQTTEEEITEPGFIELTTENIADYLAFDYYCNDFHSQPGAVELLCITTRPRQPGKFYDCWISLGDLHRQQI